MHKDFRRLGALLLSAAMTAALLGGCSDGQAAPAAVPVEQAAAVQAGETESAAGSAMQEDKTETVYVQADASGAPREITVETVLRNPGAGQSILDVSTLSGIKNTQGDEEFTQDGASLVWQNHGEDIHYKGSASGQLPVTVRISYYLDGRLVTPEELAGQTGQVRIRFDYENNVSRTVEVNGREITVQVPFTVLSALVLPADTFREVEVSGGKVISMDDQNIAVGLVFPGLAESLNLAGYEPTEDVTIQDYVEITAYATDFALEFTATVVTPGLFADLDLDDLDDIDDLIDDMEELTDASRELVDGTAELFDGAQTFGGYLDTYMEGVKALDEGAAALSEGLELLNSQKGNLETGAAALQTGLETLNASLAQFAAADSEGEDASEEDPQAAAQQALMAAATALFADAQTLAAQLEGMDATLTQLAGFAVQANEYSDTVQAQVATAETALSAASAALEELDGIASAASPELSTEELQALSTSLTDEQKAALKIWFSGVMNDRLSTGSTSEGDSEGDSEDDSEDDSGSDSTAVSISEIKAQVQAQIERAQAALNNISLLSPPEPPTLDTNEISATIADMQAQLQILSAYGEALAGMSTQLTAVADALTALQTGTAQLAAGSAQLTAGIAAFNQGIGQLYDGSVQLSDGTAELAEAGGELADGFGALTDGLRQLKEGFATFDEDGIQKLADLAGDDLAALADRLRALQAADAGYINYAGIAPGQTGSVRFILETDEIKSE